MKFGSDVSFLFGKSSLFANRDRVSPFSRTCPLVSSLVGEITEASTENLKDLSDTEKYGDDGEGVHGAEEDGLLKVFGHHALGHVEGLFQGARVTHVQRVDLVEKRSSRGEVRAQPWFAEGSSRLAKLQPTWNPKRWLCSQKAMTSRMMRRRTEIM